jgi:hypothetical protein
MIGWTVSRRLLLALLLLGAGVSGCGPEAADTPAPADPAPAPGDAPDAPDPRVQTAFSLTQSAPEYVPGETVTVSVTMDYSGDDPVTALGIRVEIPAGWQYAGVVGELRPAVEPPAGTRGELTFVWIQVPGFPATLEYELDVPEDATGTCTVTAQAIYRALAGELHSPAVTLTLDSAGE